MEKTELASSSQAGTSLVVSGQRGEEEQTEVNMHMRLRPAVSLLLFTLSHQLPPHHRA